MRFLFGEGCRKFLHALQEHDDLVGGPAADVGNLGLEFWFASVVVGGGERFPLVGQAVADVGKGGVEIGFGREAGGEEPGVPV